MDSHRYRDRVVVAAAIAALTVLLVLLVWQVGQVLLVVFAGTLLAVGWAGLARWLSHRLPLGSGGALALVLLASLACAVATGAWIGPAIADQATQLGERIPEAMQALEDRPWVERLRSLWSPEDGGGLRQRLLGSLGGAFSSALGVLANVLIVLFIGVYGALDPGVYQRALIALVPPPRRERAAAVLAACAHALRWWLVGRLASMSVVGVLTATALAIAGIPLALVLGLLAGLLSFIPYVGPILSAVPALLVGLGQGSGSVLAVLAIYAGVQLVESYLITPLVQQRAVSLPPAALLTAQLLGGVLFGLLGVLLATPLTVALIVLVRMLYLEDVLGDETPGRAPTADLAPRAPRRAGRA